MFGYQVPTVCDAWSWLARYNDESLTIRSSWINKQYEYIITANWLVFKHIKQGAKKRHERPSGEALYIPVGNVGLLRDHLEGQNKIQDNYKSELFVMVSQHQDPNIYTIGPLYKESITDIFLTWKYSKKMLTNCQGTKAPIYQPNTKLKEPQLAILIVLDARPNNLQ